MRVCPCPTPVRGANPRDRDWCNRCCGFIDPDAPWAANDRNLEAFLDRLSATYTAEPEFFGHLREHIERREAAGRQRFDLAYLSRDNLAEGYEEACDGILYLWLDVLKARRDGLGDADLDLALTAAFHFAQAYEALIHLRAKRCGAP